MHLVENKISLTELEKMSKKMFGGFVKAVVDIEKQIMAVDAELHADLEVFLLDQNSKQQYLWGVNIYPEKIGDSDWIEFDSMINVRPSQGNFSRDVEDLTIQDNIRDVVNKLVTS